MDKFIVLAGNTPRGFLQLLVEEEDFIDNGEREEDYFMAGTTNIKRSGEVEIIDDDGLIDFNIYEGK